MTTTTALTSIAIKAAAKGCTWFTLPWHYETQATFHRSLDAVRNHIRKVPGTIYRVRSKSGHCNVEG